MAALFSSRLTSAYTALRGELGAPQTATDTIEKLVERINTSAAVEDRRSAVLGLKGLSRDWKEDVGSRAMTALIAILLHDAPHDVEIAKATLETLMQLCETAEKPTKDDLGLRFTDVFLASPQPLHSLLSLLSISPSFYPRFYTLQFLSQLLAARAPIAQSYLMAAPPPGVEGILQVLDPRAQASTTASGMGGGAGEMLRNEALLLLPGMLAGNADLQKIVAFSGAFEKLFDIIGQEGGIDGGIVVQDTLTVTGGLLRFNVSNQNYFRELSLIPAIPSILGFPTLPQDAPSPDEFALQFWPEQKIFNAGLVLGLVRMLVGGPGGNNQSAMVSGGVTRCLLEVALASNAPSGLKAQALNTLTPILLSSTNNQEMMSSILLSPLVAVPADEEHPNGGFVRLPVKPAVVALVTAVIEGDSSAGGRGLRGRAAGVNMFEAYVTGNDDARIGVLASMVAPPTDNPNSQFPDEPQSAGSLILSGVLDVPQTEEFDPYRPLFSCLLLSHLVRNSEHAKKIARGITFPSGDSDSAIQDDDDDKVSLLQVIVGNLMMASRAQTEAANKAAKEGRTNGTEEEDWTRVMVGYLVLLCTWFWDSPKTVKEFLSESANLQVLIQPITQATGIDPLVQGLSAFLLGVCYEFNREPGEVTRATLYPILHSRIGPDQFVSRMARLREDPRFRAVQPDAFDTEGAENIPPPVDEAEEIDEGLELWFDWAFVDFWKNHYYTIQRSIAIDPDAVRGAPSTDDGETAAIIMNLRQKLKSQTEEVMNLQQKLTSLVNEHKEDRNTLITEVTSLSEQVASHSTLSEESRSKIDGLTKELEVEKSASQSSKTDYEALQAKHAKLDEEHDKVKSALEQEKAKKNTKGGKAGNEEKEKDNVKRIADLEKELAAEKEKRAENEKEQEDLLVLLEELSQKRKKDKLKMKEAGMEVSDIEDDEDDDDGDDE
ncbi:intracellular protein transport protein USO1, partial [Tremellales sp. Uapishka_1]